MSKRSNNKYPDDETAKLVEQLEQAGWRVGSIHDDDADISRCGDLIRANDKNAARALFQGQLGAPVDIRGQPPRDIFWIYVDPLSGGKYYFPFLDKPRSTRKWKAPPTFAIERTIIGDEFWIERSIVEPRGMGWVATDGGIWLRRRRRARRQ
jgi:hypothetical protein